MGLILLDSLVVPVSYFLALVLRFQGRVPSHYLLCFRNSIWMLIVAYGVVGSIFGLYGCQWQAAGIQELSIILTSGAVTLGGVFTVELLWARPRHLPLSVVLAGGISAVGGLALVRYRRRLIRVVVSWLQSVMESAGRQKTGFGYWLPIALVGIGLLALALRVWGIDFGLPYSYHPDEPLHAKVAMKTLLSGSLNPHYFRKGSLYIYLLMLTFIPYFFWGVSGGKFAKLEDMMVGDQLNLPSGELLAPGAFLAGRALFAAFGVVTVFLVYLLGRRLYDERVGILAALFLAVSPVHAACQSHASNADIPMTVFIVAAALLCYEILERGGSAQRYVLGGFAGGLAGACKYNAYPVIVLLNHGFCAQ